MSHKIDFNKIETAAKNAGSAAKYLGDMATDLDNRFSKKLNSVSGSDPKYNVGSAKDLVKEKIKKLNAKKDYLNTASTKLTEFARDAKDIEKGVADKMKSMGEQVMGKNPGGFKGFIQSLYESFCVDFLNRFAVTRALGNFFKKAHDWVGNKFRKIKNYFVHGNGRYILGIIRDVIGVVVSVMATVNAVVLAVGAVLAAIAGGPLAIPLVIAAVAAVVATTLTIHDSVISIKNKMKALKISKNENDPGKARYYGDIDGYSDKTKKTDYGGKLDNAIHEGMGIAHDVTKAAAEVTSAVAGTVGQAGMKKGYRTLASGKREYFYAYDPKLVKVNLKKVIRERMGFEYKKGKWDFSLKNFFRKDYRNNKRLSNNEKGFIETFSPGGYNFYKKNKTVSKILGLPKKVSKLGSGIGDLADGKFDFDDVKSVSTIIGTVPLNGGKGVKLVNDTVVKIIDTIIDAAS